MYRLYYLSRSGTLSSIDAPTRELPCELRRCVLLAVTVLPEVWVG